RRNKIGKPKKNHGTSKGENRRYDQRDHMTQKQLGFTKKQSVITFWNHRIDGTGGENSCQNHTHHAADSMTREYIKSVVQLSFGSPVVDQQAGNKTRDNTDDNRMRNSNESSRGSDRHETDNG